MIDLQEVTFFGSAGLTLLVEAKSGAEEGTWVRVVASSAALRPVQLSGLEGAWRSIPPPVRRWPILLAV